MQHTIRPDKEEDTEMMPLKNTKQKDLSKRGQKREEIRTERWVREVWGIVMV